MFTRTADRSAERVTDGFAALHLANTSDAVVIDVAAGAALHEPIHVIDVTVNVSRSQSSFSVVPCDLIIAGLPPPPSQYTVSRS